MSETRNGGGAEGQPAVAACAECGSANVRPSESSYPLDKEKVADGTAGFWRCSDCGARFLGPWTLPGKRRPHSRSKSGGSQAALDRDIQFARTLKRWIFPALVILATILAVMYILERRDPRPQQIILPDQ